VTDWPPPNGPGVGDASLSLAVAVAWPGARTDPGARPVSERAIEEFIMAINKDQVKGAAKDIGGKIQEEVGKLIGSKGQQAKGLKTQAKGKIQKGVSDLKEAVSDLKEAVKKG
jgi:uncharacterized protein YjbJ (UPF0337 family)